ncbi:MAG: hypothetical protein KY468_16045, partial [Armatimonadetes bacterium]|nr:hypothetical protein [Armatimonadota bacterium]
FELTAKKADNSRGGTITVTDPANTQLIGSPPVTSPQYIAQTSQGTAEGQPDVGPTWSFQWTAPPQGSGNVTFYAAGNAANGNSSASGDFIYTTNAVSREGAVAAPCLGDVNGDKSLDVTDAILVLKHVAGIELLTPAQSAVADANRDQQVNVGDAVKILRVSVSLDTDLPSRCP